MLLFGCGLNAAALVMMSNLSLGMDYWSLAVPRFLQGFAQGFIFVPLQTLALATIRLERLSNATAAFNVVRNVGGSIGVAMITTLLVRRASITRRPSPDTSPSGARRPRPGCSSGPTTSGPRAPIPSPRRGARRACSTAR